MKHTLKVLQARDSASAQDLADALSLTKVVVDELLGDISIKSKHFMQHIAEIKHFDATHPSLKKLEELQQNLKKLAVQVHLVANSLKK